jgi:hypothetical protein
MEIYFPPMPQGYILIRADGDALYPILHCCQSRTPQVSALSVLLQCSRLGIPTRAMSSRSTSTMNTEGPVSLHDFTFVCLLVGIVGLTHPPPPHVPIPATLPGTAPKVLLRGALRNLSTLHPFRGPLPLPKSIVIPSALTLFIVESATARTPGGKDRKHGDEGSDSGSTRVLPYCVGHGRVVDICWWQC